MVEIETLRNLGNGHFIIPVWEVVFYVLVITIYALMDRPRSCLINTYAFTFYWGFRSLLPKTLTADISQAALLMYIVCGLAVYTLITVASLQLAPRGGKVFRENSGTETS